MKCPMCGRQATVSYQTGRMTCSSCGWGTKGFKGQGAEQPGQTPRPAGGVKASTVLLLWLFLGVIVGGLYYAVFVFLDVRPSVNNIGAFVTILAVYALLGYLVRPKVDTSNLGWLGGLIDRPFSWSDDWERAKLKWLIVFYPGRLMACAVIAVFRLIAGRRSREKPPSRLDL